MTIYCFLELSVGLAAIPGKIILELFDTHVPKVVENFRALCTGEYDGLHYSGTQFHRIIETFTIQGGDTSGTGTGGSHVYGDTEQPFAGDDLFWRDTDEEMLLCMAEVPPRSQFFITLRPSPHLNGSHCCFGRVIRGQQILRQISEVEVDDDDKPLEPVTISRCGELEYKGPTVVKSATEQAASAPDAPKPVQAAEELPQNADTTQNEDKPNVHNRERRSRSREHRSSHRRRRSRESSDRGRYNRADERYKNDHRYDDKKSRYDDRRHDHRNARYDDDYRHSRRSYQPYSPPPGRAKRHYEDIGDSNEKTSSIKYKGRGKMVYQGESKSRESFGRLT